MTTTGSVEDWAALNAEARAHGFPGVESYITAYAAGYRPGDGSAGAEQAEAFARAADAAGLPLAAFVTRAVPEAEAEIDGSAEEQGPDEEPWLGDHDSGGLRPVSDTRSLSVAADSRPAPVPAVRPETTTITTTTATIAVVEANGGSFSPAASGTEHEVADHDFGTGTPDHEFGAGTPVDPGAADSVFDEGHSPTPAEIEARGPAFGVTDSVDSSHLPPGDVADPGTGLGGQAGDALAGTDLAAAGNDLPADGVPVDDLPDRHVEPVDVPGVDPEPPHDPGPAGHDGGESW